MPFQVYQIFKVLTTSFKSTSQRIPFMVFVVSEQIIFSNLNIAAIFLANHYLSLLGRPSLLTVSLCVPSQIFLCGTSKSAVSHTTFEPYDSLVL